MIYNKDLNFTVNIDEIYDHISYFHYMKNTKWKDINVNLYFRDVNLYKKRWSNLNQFEIVEKVGISYSSYSDAVKQIIKNVDKQVYWFEIIEQRGRVTEDQKIEFQVVVKIGHK